MVYLDEWEKSVNACEEFEYGKREKAKMLLSKETLLGIRMTGKTGV